MGLVAMPRQKNVCWHKTTVLQKHTFAINTHAQICVHVDERIRMRTDEPKMIDRRSNTKKKRVRRGNVFVRECLVDKFFLSSLLCYCVVTFIIKPHTMLPSDRSTTHERYFGWHKRRTDNQNSKDYAKTSTNSLHKIYFWAKKNNSSANFHLVKIVSIEVVS